MNIYKIAMGIGFFLITIIFQIVDRRNASIYKKLDERFYRKFRNYPNFFWQEDFPRRYWSRTRPGVYGKILKIKSYDATYCWLKTLSEEEFNFIKKIPLSTQKKIISHMTFKIYLLYFFIIFLIVMVLADGGLDYLLEPIIYHTS